MIKVTHMFRHPIKSHGREALEEVELVSGHCMPWDRTWAVTHEATRYDTSAPSWVPCANFMLGARTPGLAGIWAVLDTETRRVTLTHSALDLLEFCPDDPTDVRRFLDWVAPLCPDNRAGPIDIISVPGRGMTDSPLPAVSVMNRASHAAVEEAVGAPVEIERWRGNIWLDGLAPWAEHDLVGQTLKVGDATLRIVERIPRCSHTAANPHTGMRDMDLVARLEQDFDHSDFGMQAEVVEGGLVRIDDEAVVL